MKISCQGTFKDIEFIAGECPKIVQDFLQESEPIHCKKKKDSPIPPDQMPFQHLAKLQFQERPGMGGCRGHSKGNRRYRKCADIL